MVINVGLGEEFELIELYIVIIAMIAMTLRVSVTYR